MCRWYWRLYAGPCWGVNFLTTVGFMASAEPMPIMGVPRTEPLRLKAFQLSDVQTAKQRQICSLFIL